MTWLTILLSVLTLTVESKSSVVATGDIPPFAEASYTCSYQKGTVRQGDEAVLILSDLGGLTINKVEVYIRSNQKAGAGTWTVTIDGQKAATKSGTFEQWFGAYDNTNLHALSLLPNSYSGVQEMTIRLEGTANSLYIDRYVISYTPAPVHSVTLMRGDEVFLTLTETTGGAGVFLPSMDDYNGWRFIGWTETECGQTTTRPDLIAPNTQCFLMDDAVLWAAYECVLPEDSIYVSELTEGEFLYTNTRVQMALAGIPDENGWMEPDLLNRMDRNQQYSFAFNAAKDTAYLIHTATRTPIGYNDQRKLVTAASPWRVYHEGNETILYATIANKNYVLWLNVQDGGGENMHVGLLAANPQNSPMKLAYPASEDEQIFTCHPEFGMGFDNPLEMNKNEYIFPFGSYDLIIRNGEKELRLR